MLITGGAGHIGYMLARKLIAVGYDAIIFDNDPKKESLLMINGDTDIIINDVRNLRAVSKAIAQVEGVIHLAAVSRVVWGYKDPGKCTDINVNGTLSVLNGIRTTKNHPFIIFGSSREVYGEQHQLPCQECSPKKGVNVYGETKILGEKLIEAFYRNNGIRGIILRFSNVFGSRWDQLDRVIPKFIKSALENEPLILQGGKQIFDPTYIDDTVEGILHSINALERDKIHFDDFHVLRGEPVKLVDLAERIIESLDSSSAIEYSPARDYDVQKFYGNPKKARDLLHFTCKTSLDKALDLTINDLRDYWNM